jgi:hypothetical protein
LDKILVDQSTAVRRIAQALARELTAVSSDRELRIELGGEPVALAFLNELARKELALDMEDPQVALVLHCFDEEVAVVLLDNEPMDEAATAVGLSHAADQLQDHVIDCLEAAWPKCPDHEHPLTASVRDEVAVWVCPMTDAVHRRIGDV